MVIKCNVLLADGMYKEMAQDFATQLAAGCLLLPPYCEILPEVPNDGTVLIVAEAQVLQTVRDCRMEV